MKQKFNDFKTFILWHEPLGHLGISMMHHIIQTLMGITLRSRQILAYLGFIYVACSQEKLIIKPYISKIVFESLTFLERIQWDICGPIHLLCGPFHLFMVLIGAST